MWKSKIAGQDGLTRRALPAGEFFHILSLSAFLLLIVNDWYLKPSTWAPPLLTGKLSDFAGLLFFPLLLTALFDCFLLLLARLGTAVDFTLRRYKLLIAIGATGAAFSAIKLNPLANAAAIRLAEEMGLAAQVVADPSDLIALPVLWLTWRIGLAEIARVPLGRMELIQKRHERSGVVAGDSLHDIVPAGADPELAKDLVEALHCYLAVPESSQAHEVETALAKLRDP